MLPFINFLTISMIVLFQVKEQKDYFEYHQQVIRAEKLICTGNYEDAFLIYEDLFENYDFVFVHDYQVASQLAIILDEHDRAKELVKKGMLAGWDLKSIKKNDFIRNGFDGSDWNSLKTDYDLLRKTYEAKFDVDLLNKIKELFKADQKNAIGALFKFSAEAQDSYAEKKFAPHSELQMAKLEKIIEEKGYPGEKITGNNYWVSTIISHHNSISQKYNKSDEIYPDLKLILLKALGKGEISPAEFAIIDDWYLTTIDQTNRAFYGILNPPNYSELSATNDLREKIFLRPVETRNQLIETEYKTGMNFYLDISPWLNGKMEIKE